MEGDGTGGVGMAGEGTGGEGMGWEVHWPLMDGLLLTAHPSTASVLTSYYSMWHNNCL